MARYIAARGSARRLRRRKAGAALALGTSLLVACTLHAPGPPTDTAGGAGATTGGSTTSGTSAGGSTRTGGTTHGGAATGSGGAKPVNPAGSPGSSESGADNAGGSSDPDGGAPASAGSTSVAGTSSHDFCDPPCGAHETCDRGIACVCDLDACPKACTDLKTDPKNCGTCGNVCADQCFGGHCLQQLAAINASGVVNLALAKTHIYFTELAQGTLSRIPIAGGSEVVLASGQAQPLGVAVDDVNVYWVNQGVDQDGQVMKLARDGNTPAKALVEGELRPSAVAIDASNVYWTNDADAGSVAKVPIAGGTRVELATGDELWGPKELVVNGAYVYWINQGFNANGSVMRVPTAGGTATTLVADLVDPRFIAYYGANLYFTKLGPGAGGIEKVNVSGTGSSSLATIQRAAPIAVDSTGIYCAGFGKAPGDIARISLDGTTVTTLASSPLAPSAIAIDASNVYWSTSKGIYAVPK